MKTLADLDKVHRTIPSHVIRQMTGDRTGRYPHDHLWRDMRQSAGITLRQRKLTQLEAIRLIAVTVVYQETRELPQTLVQVNRIASELLSCKTIEDLFSTLQERKLSATELREAIARMSGKKPAESTLYLWGHQLHIPYRRNGQYTPKQVQRFISFAHRSCVQNA